MVKNLVKRLFVTTSIIGVAVILISWGSTGHYKISNLCSLSFNPEMSEFNDWIPFLREHASDADYRKDTDPNEQYNHYLDIELFAGFSTTGTINQTSYPSKYNGILPWATETTFNYLKNALAAHEWDLAKQYAADLGHYVADGHMPLHITENYNGQNTGQTGIHSRYESTMIYSYNSQITYSGSDVNVISNVNQYIFDYIYENHKYVDSVLEADTYATNLAGGSTTSTTYKTALWNKTKGFTIKMFKNGSHALAELIYTAWVQAGKPSLSTGINENSNFTELLEQNYPNPFTTSTRIKYNIFENSDVTLRVTDILGKNVAILYSGSRSVGAYEVEWTPQGQTEGIYFVVLDTKKEHKVKKMLLVK